MAPSRLPKPAETSRQSTRALHTGSAEWRRLREETLVRDGYACQHCGRVVTGKGEAHVDHINGDDSDNRPENRQTLCAPCHSAKTVREDRGFGNPNQ